MTEPMRSIDGALVFDKQDRPRADVLADARAQLAEGRHHLDVDDALVDRQGLVVRAWWGGDDVGFVQEAHPGAVPVTVVNVPTAPRAVVAEPVVRAEVRGG